MSQIQSEYFDQKLQRLRLILLGLNDAVTFFNDEEVSIDWYGVIDVKKELESVYKLAFLAIEYFIESSIRDIVGEVPERDEFYKMEPHVELIICLAKLSGRDSGEGLRVDVLGDYGLSQENYPLYNGLAILSEGRNFLDIMPLLVRWRQKIIELVYCT